MIKQEKFAITSNITYFQIVFERLRDRTWLHCFYGHFRWLITFNIISSFYLGKYIFIVNLLWITLNRKLSRSKKFTLRKLLLQLVYLRFPFVESTYGKSRFQICCHDLMLLCLRLNYVSQLMSSLPLVQGHTYVRKAHQ